MSGPNVSVSNSDSNNCSSNLSVTLLSSSYLPGSQYCVIGSHVVFSGSPTTSTACLTTPGVARVVKVDFERIVTDDLAIDVNPNAQGGLRIFPDKKNPTDMENRRKIRVRAKYGTNTSGVRIYFRSFDLDDPSANSAPVDDEPTLNAGDDNNGNVDGTANTKAGQLSFPPPPAPNPNMCQPAAYGISCLTDSNGEATAEFTLTMQPGDNFTVAAGSDATYLSSLGLAADGINLKDNASIQTPVTTTANPYACYGSSINACRADMLTVWRRLHIEYDRMANVSTGNKIEGQFATSGRITSSGLSSTVVAVNNTSSNLDEGRFVGGRIVFGSRSLPLTWNSLTEVYIKNTTGTSISYSQGQNFTIYDDDDYNNDDGASLNGDSGEPII